MEIQGALDRLYDQARRHVVHEDDLVDRRLKWTITISGFLFAAYGATWIAYPKSFPVQDTEVSINLTVVQIVLCMFGFLASLISVPSIHAAHLAIRAITRKYSNFVEANEHAIRAQKAQVWKLIGDKVTHLPGFYSSLYLPILLASIWTIVMSIDVSIISYIVLSQLGMRSDFYCAVFVIVFATAGILFLLWLYSWKLKQRLETAVEESETVKKLRASGDLKNVSVISEDTFQFELFPSDEKPVDSKGQSDV